MIACTPAPRQRRDDRRPPIIACCVRCRCRRGWCVWGMDSPLPVRSRSPCHAGRCVRAGQFTIELGDESRILRCGYGPAEIYSRSPDNRASSGATSMRAMTSSAAPVASCGVLWIAPDGDRYAEETLATLDVGATRSSCSIRLPSALAILTLTLATSLARCSSPRVASSWPDARSKR